MSKIADVMGEAYGRVKWVGEIAKNKVVDVFDRETSPVQIPSINIKSSSGFLGAVGSHTLAALFSFMIVWWFWVLPINKEWRERIEAARQGVVAQVDESNSVLSKEDAEIIDELGDTHARLKSAEAQLVAARQRLDDNPDARCVVPRSCLSGGVRGQ